WGANGFYKVWLNEKNSWMYPYQHDAERRMTRLASSEFGVPSSELGGAGRPWKVTTPDGAVVETTYGLAAAGSCLGTTVTVEDQADKQGRSVTMRSGSFAASTNLREVGRTSGRSPRPTSSAFRSPSIFS
ncbi:MAG: hypothetical protein ABR535_09015, partial [Pyrinomonadaceae bacterium]